MKIPADVEKRLRSKIEMGRYRSLDEILDRALDALETVEQEDDAIRQSIIRSVEQYEKGEAIAGEKVYEKVRERNRAYGKLKS